MYNRRYTIVCHTEEAATIFDIQSFSLQDGPGIRTTVFFKGCPLHCIWCHNPESYVEKPQIMFHRNLCVGCLACTSVCPTGAQSKQKLNGQWIHTLDRDKCIACGSCIKVCCYQALDLLGKRYTEDELFKIVQRDFHYYNIKTAGQNGGITFSGGEPMLWVNFIENFIKMIPGVHIAMETSGYAKREDFRRLIGKIDLFLFDYKATDARKHKRLCGTDNSLILQNLEMLYQAGCNIILRLPLIPGINDDDGHLKGIASLLSSHPRIDHAEIMAYHTIGIGKSEELGKSSFLSGLSAATPEQKQGWLDRLHALGAGNVILSK
jgi:glycyl-radical enzyme activating protein